MKGTTSLILGALLVAGLSLALACCGTLDPQIEAGPAVTATLTAQVTEKPTPTSTAMPTAPPIAAPRWAPSPSPPCNRTSMHGFWTGSGSSEPLNHDSAVLQRTEGTLPDPSGLVETR